MSDDNRDDHESPANPDNRIDLDRAAVDAEHRKQMLEHPPGEPEGKNLHEPLPPGAAEAVARRTGPTVSRRRPGSKAVEIKSTGHSWDGIEEYDNPLPRWWLWTFYATIVWAVLYTIAYPAWPLVSGATQGLLGTTARQEVAAEIQRFADANSDVQTRLASAELDSIAGDPELANYAGNAGAAVFRTWCAQCHGAGAGGNPGYPSLLDNAWLWGGTMEDIHYTLTHGIRWAEDPDTRYSEMPRFGADGILEPAAIDQVTQYVLALSGQDHDAGLAAEGAVVYEDNCSACHGADGEGDRFQGAPALNDQIWLYGGDAETIRNSIHFARFGVMPAWSDRLSEADLRAVAHYVHSLGGGE